MGKHSIVYLNILLIVLLAKNFFIFATFHEVNKILSGAHSKYIYCS